MSLVGGTLSRLVGVGVLAVAAATGGSVWYWADQHRAAQEAAQKHREGQAATAAYETAQRELVGQLQVLPLGRAFRPATSYLGNAGVCGDDFITVGCWSTELRPPVAARHVASALNRAGFGAATVRCDDHPYCLVQVHDTKARSISYRLMPYAGTTDVGAIAAR